MSINIYADLSLNAWASYTPLLGQLRPKRQSWEAQAIHRSPFRARQTKLSAQPGPSHPKNQRYLRKKKLRKLEIIAMLKTQWGLVWLHFRRQGDRESKQGNS